MSTSPYNQAGKLLQQILSDRKSIKTVAFSKSKLVCSKSTYAQVCSTIQHKSVIDSILDYNGKHLRKAIQMGSFRNEGLVYVLLYELLFGKYHSIRGGGKIKRCIMKFEKELNETKAKVVMHHQQGNETKVIPVFPRYVRVNKLKTTSEDVVIELRKALGVSDDEDRSHVIYQDAHIPDLLVMSPKTKIQWHESDIVKTGKVILQDKSSCFSALALVHGSEESNNEQFDFIDATAAPGNKTLHLASLIYDKIMKKKLKNSKGSKKQKCVKVFAFDRSSSRISILKNRLNDHAPSVLLENQKNIVKNEFPVTLCPMHQDFLRVDPKDKMYKNVTSILLDPSCSGSGIVNSPDRIADTMKSNESDENRIESLSNFQLVALKHAMSFPQCLRIVYSTCSINQRENEDVVAAALLETNEKIDDDDMKWEIVSPVALQHWKRRGYEVETLTKEQSESLIRVNGMDGDNTNGFFVSYFERKSISKNKKESKKVDLVREYSAAGLNIYNGEFTVDSQRDIIIEKIDKEQNNPCQSTSSQKQTTKPKLPNKVMEANTTKQLPRKVAKKLKWKQKQKELKLARLKSKNESK